MRLICVGTLLLITGIQLEAAAPAQQPAAVAIHFHNLAAGPCMSKGRIQDPEHDKSQRRLAEMDRIIRHGTGSILALSEALTNSRPVTPLLCGWKGMAIGDVALVTLLDLFRDPGGRSTVPELEWDTFLERSSPNIPAEQVLRDFIRKHRRQSLREKWNTFWKEHQDEIIWDEHDRCYRARPGHPQ
jgi:hypothetical protein